MKLRPTLKSAALKQVTARDFSGGLNLVDSEFNLSSRYAVDGYNTITDDSGGVQVRWGTRLFTNFVDGTLPTRRLVGMTYYYRYLVYVLLDPSGGVVVAVDASGVGTVVFSTPIAATLPGAPAGWGTTFAQVDFAQYLGSLIITNGVDKPIIIDNTLKVQYLQDLGSGSNINVPVAKYIAVHDNYVVMAGDSNKPGRLYISNSGTSGTWVGDAPPNDSITFDVDKYVEDSTGEIIGITSWRDRLVVFFAQGIVSVRLGTYSTATTPVHTPKVDDAVPAFGAVSNRAVLSIGEALLFLDATGVSQVKQATFTTSLQPSRISTLIDIRIQRSLVGKSSAFLQYACHAVYDKRENRVMFFIPDTSYSEGSYTVYVGSLGKGSQPVWSVFTGWDFKYGAVSQEGRVFLANAYGSTYLYGSKHEPILSDYEGAVAYDGPATENVGVYVNGLYTPPTTRGKGIKFRHEFPQSPMGDRTRHKTLHYVSMDTQGASSFTLTLSLDDTYKRGYGLGELFSDGTLFSDGYGLVDSTVTPVVNTYSMNFIGGDRGALAVALPVQSANGYRPTDNMGLYAIYGRCKFLKLIISGTSYAHFRLVGLSIHYTEGSIY